MAEVFSFAMSPKLLAVVVTTTIRVHVALCVATSTHPQFLGLFNKESTLKSAFYHLLPPFTL